MMIMDVHFVRKTSILLLAFSSVFFLVTAIEMYVLTLLHGPQMLFFSLLHIAPLIFLVVLAASALAYVFHLILGLVVVALNLAKKSSWGETLSSRMRLVILFQVIHTFLLLTYSYWSSSLFSTSS